MWALWEGFGKLTFWKEKKSVQWKNISVPMKPGIGFGLDWIHWSKTSLTMMDNDGIFLGSRYALRFSKFSKYIEES
jgi:hypothetical protein